MLHMCYVLQQLKIATQKEFQKYNLRWLCNHALKSAFVWNANLQKSDGKFVLIMRSQNYFYSRNQTENFVKIFKWD